MKPKDFLSYQAFGTVADSKRIGSFIDTLVMVLWLVFFLVA